MFDGRRTCSCKEHSKGNQLSADAAAKSLDLVDRNGTHLGAIAYIRGLENPRHTDAGPIIQAIRDTATCPAPSSESSSADEGMDGDDERPCTGFSSSSSSADDGEQPDHAALPRPARQRRLTSTRDDILDEPDHDGHRGAGAHAPPNTPQTSPPTAAAQEAMPSEEDSPVEESSPKTNRSGRRRDQMPYKPRRYKGRRSR